MFLKLWAFAVVFLLHENIAQESSPLSLFHSDVINKLTSSFNLSTSELESIFNLMILHKKKHAYLEELFKKEATFPEMANEVGLEVDDYDLITPDGYILKLFHIKGNGTGPVLLMHGLLDSADAFILRGKTSHTKTLVDAGYDVYIGNARGNKYSRKHVSMNPDVDADYWDFSFHEMAVYDLPTFIDFILKQQEAPSLYVIGHSQGNLIMWIMGSERPEYNKKVKVAIALAPVSFIQNLERSSLQVLIDVRKEIMLVIDTLKIVQVGQDGGFIRILLDFICEKPQGSSELCVNGIINPLQGFDNSEIGSEFFINKFIPHFPTSTSTKDLYHILQFHTRKKFARYNYGLIKNLIKYWSIDPPEYDLWKVTMKVALFQGRNDYLSAISDTEMLRRRLPNVIEFKLIDRLECTHFDFLHGKNAPSYVMQPVFQIMNKYP